MSVECEKFVPQKKRWEKVASMLDPCLNCSMCEFHDRFIYRFGGKMNYRELSKAIHRYDREIDSWENIPLRISADDSYLDMRLACVAGSVQVSDNELLIFGGVSEDYSKQYNGSFVFKWRQDGSHIIERVG